MDGDDSASRSARSRSGSSPATQRSASSRAPFDSSRSCSRTARDITGTITFSSKLPLAPAHATVASWPTTCAQTCSTDSGTTGLTFPGMIDEPGWRSGR